VSLATEHGIKTRLVVGMEVHVELATRTKMFTGAPNVAHSDFQDAPPNTLTDPMVLGMPGTLPVINKRAVEMSILVGLALNCQIAKFTKWDRKSYYYPDLPKNYQISQYDLPLCFDGAIDVPLSDEADASTKRIGIIRAHLEEDAGKLMHEAPGGAPIDYSIIDLNRAGTPLLEIVTEPDFETAEQCVRFAQMLRDICRHLGVSEGVMQRGHMRFEPNINVIIERDGKTYKTPIVEVKNLNSFKSLYGAVQHEYERQVEEWLATGRVHGMGEKSTRGWDDVKQVTLKQREKEDAHEYRYFPDPDLVPVVVSEVWLDQIRAELPELPQDRLYRYIHDIGLNVKDAQALIEQPQVTRFFEEVLATGIEPRRAAAMLLNYGAKRANERNVRIDELGITPTQIRQIADLAAADKISSSAADELFAQACEQPDASVESLAKERGLLQVSDVAALEAYVDEVIANEKNAKIVSDIAGGKDAAIGALLGQVMKLSKGQANPKMVGELIKKKLRK